MERERESWKMVACILHVEIAMPQCISPSLPPLSLFLSLSLSPPLHSCGWRLHPLFSFLPSHFRRGGLSLSLRSYMQMGKVHCIGGQRRIRREERRGKWATLAERKEGGTAAATAWGQIGMSGRDLGGCLYVHFALLREIPREGGSG